MRQRWHKALLEPNKRNVLVRAGPAVADDGSQLFIGGKDGALYALSTEDGSMMWPREENEGQILSTPVVNGTVVYELLLYGPYRIRARHVETGREIWTYPPEEEG